MAPYVVTGQGYTGPLQRRDLRGPMHFWSRHHRFPPVGNSLIVYNDGEVVEGVDFTNVQTTHPDVVRVFLGGQKHVIDSVEDAFLYDSLVAAGYDLIPAT